MCCAFENINWIISVKLEIKEFKDLNNNTLHVAVALQSIKKSEIVNTTKAVANNGQANVSPSFIVSIADLFRKTNPKDTPITKYLPGQFLNDGVIDSSPSVTNTSRSWNTSASQNKVKRGFLFLFLCYT